LTTFASSSQDGASRTGILHALNTFADEKADLSCRLEAGRHLTLAAGRMVLVLCMTFAIVRLGIALVQLLEVLFWPIGITIKVLRWVLGAGF